LLMRRLNEPRVSAVSRPRDTFVIGWLLATVTIGLLTVIVSVQHASHGDASTMIALSQWVQSVATLSVDASLLNGVSFIYKLHMVFGMTVFLVFPFTRLVHVWSVPVSYLGRAYQVVRTKKSQFN